MISAAFGSSLMKSFIAFSLLLPLTMLEGVYINRFTTTDNGGMLFTGNTLGLSKQIDQNEPGPADSIGAFITIDTSQKVGSYPPGTTLDWHQNSSAAFLDLPPNSTVLYAELIWSGSYGFNDQITGTTRDTPITFITPQGTSFSIVPDPVTSQQVLTPGFNSAGNYTRSAEVTSIVQSGGAGKYIAGGIPASVSALDNTHNAAGWTLAVAYHDGTQTTKNLTIFVGCEQASNTTNAPAQVSGFCSPSSGPLSGTLFVSAIEGDANKPGPHMLFGSTPSLTLAANSLSGVNNNINNFFGSQINTLFPIPSTSALLDTRGTFGNFNSNSFTGNVPYGSRQGYDITAVDVSNLLVYSQTTAYALGVTTSDDYTINSLGLQIPVGSPSLIGSKTVDSVQTVSRNVGDIVTFNFSFTNTGTANASNAVFKDILESGLTFVPGTFRYNTILQPDPNLNTGFTVGTVNIGQTFTIQFQAKITGYPPSGNVIFNSCEVDYDFSTCISGQTISLASSSNDVDIQLPFIEIPNVIATKRVNSSTAIQSEVGAVLTFQVFLTNNGTGDALNVTLSDLLEPGLTLIPNSIIVDGVTVNPDPDLNTGVPIGTIVIGETVSVVFQATIDFPPASGTLFYNHAHIDYQYKDNNDVFFDLDTDSNVVTIDLDPPPAHFRGVLKKCKFFDRTTYCLTATWDAVAGLQVISYKIYQNGNLVASIPSSKPLLYKTCFKRKRDIGVYQVSALFQGGSESARTTLVIVND